VREYNMRRSKRGVAAQVHFLLWRHPTQIKNAAAAAHKKGSL